MFIIILISLIQLLKQNEKEGIKEVLKRYIPDVIRFLRIKLSGNYELAEEMSQEAALLFIKAINNKKIVFINENKIKNYLLTIAMNIFRNYYKKNKNILKCERFFKTEEEMNNCLERISQDGLSPEDKIIEQDKDKQIKEIVNLTMSKLIEAHKNILILKFTEEKSNIDISKELNISIKAVESLLFRAKKAFKKYFKDIALKEDKFLGTEHIL